MFTAIFLSAWAKMKMFVCDLGTTGQQRKDAKALARSFDDSTDRWYLVFWKSNELELFTFKKILGVIVDGQNAVPVGR